MRQSNNNTCNQNLCYNDNLSKLNDPEIESQYSVEVQNRFSLLCTEEASDWDTFRNAVTDAAFSLPPAWVMLYSLRRNGSLIVLGN